MYSYQSLDEHVGKLFNSFDIYHPNIFLNKTFSHIVILYINMLGESEVSRLGNAMQAVFPL